MVYTLEKRGDTYSLPLDPSLLAVLRPGDNSPDTENRIALTIDGDRLIVRAVPPGFSQGESGFSDETMDALRDELLPRYGQMLQNLAGDRPENRMNYRAAPALVPF